ncbi:MAG: CPBP family intramembrane glutamic endopeptidase [Caulobacteraceae bacterium]
MANAEAAPRRSGIFRFASRIAVVRLLIFFLVLVTGYAGAQIAGLKVAALVGTPWGRLVGAAVGMALAALLLAVYAGLTRVIERRRAAEIAFWPGGALIGALLGFGLFCAAYAVLWTLGYAHVDGLSAGTTAVFAIAMTSIAAGIGEELIFRGGVFRILEQSLGTGAALILSAAMFGAMHAANPGATMVSTAAIVIEAGLLLALAYAATRNLWLPIGLHAAWNFTEGGVFGAAVSGHAGTGLLKTTLTGPPLLSGGVFGPEASIVVVGVCGLLALAFFVRARRNGQWKPMAFRMVLN